MLCIYLLLMVFSSIYDNYFTVAQNAVTVIFVLMLLCSLSLACIDWLKNMLQTLSRYYHLGGRVPSMSYENNRFLLLIAAKIVENIIHLPKLIITTSSIPPQANTEETVNFHLHYLR